jgi:hypothetical protein
MTTEMGETWKLEAHKNKIIMKFKVSLGLIALTKIRKILGGKFISKGGHIIKEDDFISLSVKHTNAKNLTEALEIVARTIHDDEWDTDSDSDTDKDYDTESDSDYYYGESGTDSDSNESTDTDFNTDDMTECE